MAEEQVATNNNTEGIEIVNLLKNGQTARSRQEVRVNFSLDHNRKTSPSIEESIEKIWREKCSNNTRLYNASKFRIAGVQTMQPDVVELDIGITSYKDLMGTNCHAHGKKLVEYSKRNFNCKHAAFSDALGIGSLLLTSDQQFLFIRRAMWTGEEPGKIDRAGGHPEPDKLTGRSNSNKEAEYQHLDCERVRDEIFDSVLSEIVDEINLPSSTLSDPLLLGAVRSNERFGRPTLEFLVR